MLLQELVEKLPANVKFNWAMYQQQFSVVDLNVFGEYMTRVTSATSSITVSNLPPKSIKDDRVKTKDKAFVNAHTTGQKDHVLEDDAADKTELRKNRAIDELTETTKRCPACKTENHQASECAKFQISQLGRSLESC
nr:uncharacterized protein LOC115267684 [Aedes albopictus]